MTPDAAPEQESPRLPDLGGRTYLVTGANAGLGYFASEKLARAGAHVIMTGRSPTRLAAAHAALDRRLAGRPASVETLLLDVGNLGSIRAAAATVRTRRRLDGLLLNAGIVHPPAERAVDGEGNELVLATNVLGHYALAGELLVPLARAAGRLVWVGSLATRMPGAGLDDPQLLEGYSPWRAYVQSKIATTVLGFEADRRLRAADVAVASIVAHPGYATSGRTAGIRGVNEPTRGTRFVDNLQAAFTQSKERGAEPLVHALAAPEVEGGQFWSPRFGTRGAPREATAAKVTRDAAAADRFWQVCRDATRVDWPFERAARAGGR